MFVAKEENKLKFGYLVVMLTSLMEEDKGRFSNLVVVLIFLLEEDKRKEGFSAKKLNNLRKVNLRIKCFSVKMALSLSSSLT